MGDFHSASNVARCLWVVELWKWGGGEEGGVDLDDVGVVVVVM